jgi:tetratricopeptide (TPR) repeat protein
MDSGDALAVTVAIFISYVIPVLAFIVGFWLSIAEENSHNTVASAPAASAGLFCAVIAVLIHNLIDFAIFEPAVLTTFWAVIAVIIAIDMNKKYGTAPRRNPTPVAKLLVTAGGLIVVFALMNYALIPVAGTAAKISVALSDFSVSHKILEQAAKEDPLDSTALNLNAKMYLQHYTSTGRKQTELLKNAERCLIEAAGRSKADYQNYELLTEIYIALAESSVSSKTEPVAYLEKALNSAITAVELYPGSAKLRIQAAQIAEKLGKTDTALEHYKRAVRIEDAYREQFRIMYPGREIFSRLGEDKYNTAKQKIESLMKQQK